MHVCVYLCIYHVDHIYEQTQSIINLNYSKYMRPKYNLVFNPTGLLLLKIRPSD